MQPRKLLPTKKKTSNDCYQQQIIVKPSLWDNILSTSATLFFLINHNLKKSPQITLAPKPNIDKGIKACHASILSSDIYRFLPLSNGVDRPHYWASPIFHRFETIVKANGKIEYVGFTSRGDNLNGIFHTYKKDDSCTRMAKKIIEKKR